MTIVVWPTLHWSGWSIAWLTCGHTAQFRWIQRKLVLWQALQCSQTFGQNFCTQQMRFDWKETNVQDWLNGRRNQNHQRHETVVCGQTLFLFLKLPFCKTPRQKSGVAHASGSEPALSSWADRVRKQCDSNLSSHRVFALWPVLVFGCVHVCLHCSSCGHRQTGLDAKGGTGTRKRVLESLLCSVWVQRLRAPLPDKECITRHHHRPEGVHGPTNLYTRDRYVSEMEFCWDDVLMFTSHIILGNIPQIWLPQVRCFSLIKLYWHSEISEHTRHLSWVHLQWSLTRGCLDWLSFKRSELDYSCGLCGVCRHFIHPQWTSCYVLLFFSWSHVWVSPRQTQTCSGPTANCRYLKVICGALMETVVVTFQQQHCAHCVWVTKLQSIAEGNISQHATCSEGIVFGDLKKDNKLKSRPAGWNGMLSIDCKKFVSASTFWHLHHTGRLKLFLVLFRCIQSVRTKYICNWSKQATACFWISLNGSFAALCVASSIPGTLASTLDQGCSFVNRVVSCSVAYIL